MDENHHVVFHDDIDGIACAALYLTNFVGDNDYRLYPISSTGRGDKLKALVKEMGLSEDDKLAILDFENHPRSNLWVDHHWNSAMGQESVKNPKVMYDLSSKSAARIMDCCGPFYQKSNYDSSFLDVVDKIDRADYESIYEVFNSREPLMLIRAYLEMTFPSKMMICRVVEVMRQCKFDMDRVLFRLNINEKILLSLKDAARKAKRNMVIFKSCSVLKMRTPGQYPRYAEFYTKEQIKYSIRLTQISNKRSYAQIGFNKWCGTENEINIGQMLSSSMLHLIKGGGHHNVGGAIVMDRDVEAFLNTITDILNNEKEPSVEEMEKYAVDKSDPVEASAENMVKTGEAKSIDEARKKSAEKSVKIEKSEQEKNKDD